MFGTFLECFSAMEEEWTGIESKLPVGRFSCHFRLKVNWRAVQESLLCGYTTNQGQVYNLDLEMNQ